MSAKDGWFKRSWLYCLLILGLWIGGGIIFFFPVSPVAAEGRAALTFLASFERSTIADVANGDEVPLDGQGVRLQREANKGFAALMSPGGSLSYDAPGNVYAGRGTVAVWWKSEDVLAPAPFSILRITQARKTAHNYIFADLSWNGSTVEVQLCDQNDDLHTLAAGRNFSFVAGRWYFLAFSWDELTGMQLFVDGRLAAHNGQAMQLDSTLDQIAIQAREATSAYVVPAENRILVDELRIYSAALKENDIAYLFQLGPGAVGNVAVAAAADAAQWKEQWEERFGWKNPRDIVDAASPVVIHKVWVGEGKELQKSTLAASDGSVESSWPTGLPGYGEEGKTLALAVEPATFNYVEVQGRLKGKLFQVAAGRKSLLQELSGAAPVARHYLADPIKAERLEVERESGALGELALYRTGPLAADSMGRNSAGMLNPGRYSYRVLPVAQAAELDGVSRQQIVTLYGLNTLVSRRYLEEDRESWVAVPSEVYKPPALPPSAQTQAHLVQVVAPGFMRNVLLEGVKLKFASPANASQGPAFVNIVLRDPADPFRQLMNIDVKLAGQGATEILLDCRDVIMPINAALWLTLASNQRDFAKNYLAGAELELQTAEGRDSAAAAAAAQDLLGDCHRQIKGMFYLASFQQDWSFGETNNMGRRYKLFDRLFRVLENARATFPQDAALNAYWQWLQPQNATPDFKQPEPADSTEPLWAFQQRTLLGQFQQVLGWWQKNRLNNRGQWGGGTSGDAAFWENVPAVALMDSSAAPAIYDRRIEGGGTDGQAALPSKNSFGNSVLGFVQACRTAGISKEGLSSRLLPASEAYREGVNAVPAAMLLNYGNPQVVEQLMETARQYTRITDINAAGHRHFLSSRLNCCDSLDTAGNGREEADSPLLWQPALLLAWYNGNPAMVKLLTEYADALLAHWQSERYPNFTRGIRFVDDAVFDRGLPSPEVINLMWGVYRLTGNNKYLWLVQNLFENGSLDLAEMTSGRWLPTVDAELGKTLVLAQVRDEPIWNHSLFAGGGGLLARQSAFEVTGKKTYVEDYQASLIKHMAQALPVYTEAEMAAGAMYLPDETLQRARLGGVALARGVIYPGLAISWEDTAGTVAALVRKSTPTSLQVIAYNSSSRLLDVKLRVWELDSGRYEIVEGTDVIGQDKIDVVTNRRQMMLKRHTAIPVALRAHRTTIIDIQQIGKGTPIAELPDIAISPTDFSYDLQADKGQLVIHNLGGKSTPPFILTVESEKHIVLYKGEIASIEAPLDLEPKSITVPLANLREQGAKALSIRLDTENKIEEINDENNQVRVTF